MWMTAGKLAHEEVAWELFGCVCYFTTVQQYLSDRAQENFNGLRLSIWNATADIVVMPECSCVVAGLQALTMPLLISCKIQQGAAGMLSEITSIIHIYIMTLLH